jgi:hypothetical protein
MGSQWPGYQSLKGLPPQCTDVPRYVYLHDISCAHMCKEEILGHKFPDRKSEWGGAYLRYM